MKSLIEEATSVEKAIEKAWARAGKPHTFSVKIFEEPETNFFGFLTKKSAKVGIFFDEKHVQQVVEEKGTKNPSVNTNMSPRPAQRNDDRPHNNRNQRNNNHRPRRDNRNQQDGRQDTRRSYDNNDDRRTDNDEFKDRRPRHEQQEPRERIELTEQRQERTERPERVERTERTERTERREHNGNREQRFDRNRRPGNRRPQQDRKPQERSTEQAPVEPKNLPAETNAPVFEFTTPSSTTGVKKNLRASSRRYSAKKETPSDDSSDNQQ